MGTRGFLGMQKDGDTRVVYNHFDSYPDCLGRNTLIYIRDSDDVRADADAWFKLPVVQEDEAPTPEQLADLKERGYWEGVSTGTDWYSALRGCQGMIPAYLQAGYLPTMSNSVLTEPDIFMEWGYVIDLDAGELVVYEGKNAGPTVVGRIQFTEIQDDEFWIDGAVAALDSDTDD